VGALDPICSETVEYVEKLKAAGVPAEVDVYERAFHGFDLAKNADVTKRAHARMMEWFEMAVREYVAPQTVASSEQ
jgi:acetyl esterase/lipase